MKYSKEIFWIIVLILLFIAGRYIGDTYLENILEN